MNNSETKPKTWADGTADNPWKIMICARDQISIDQCLSTLVYRLTDAGSNAAEGHDKLREMSGRQIVDALIKQSNGCVAAIAARMARDGK